MCTHAGSYPSRSSLGRSASATPRVDAWYAGFISSKPGLQNVLKALALIQKNRANQLGCDPDTYLDITKDHEWLWAWGKRVAPFQASARVFKTRSVVGWILLKPPCIHPWLLVESREIHTDNTINASIYTGFSVTFRRGVPMEGVPMEIHYGTPALDRAWGLVLRTWTPGKVKSGPVRPSRNGKERARGCVEMHDVSMSYNCSDINIYLSYLWCIGGKPWYNYMAVCIHPSVCPSIHPYVRVCIHLICIYTRGQNSEPLFHWNSYPLIIHGK